MLPTVKGAFFPLLSPSSPILSFSFSSFSLSLSLFLPWHLFPLPANTTVCCAELGQSLGHLGPGSGWGVQRHMIIAACVCERLCVNARVCVGAGFRFYACLSFCVCGGLAAIWGSVHIVLSLRRNVHLFVLFNEFMSMCL